MFPPHPVSVLAIVVRRSPSQTYTTDCSRIGHHISTPLVSNLSVHNYTVDNSNLELVQTD